MGRPAAAEPGRPGCKGCLCVQDPEQLQESANQILTAIIQGMRKEEPSNNVKLAATNALLNSLEFTKANFEKEVGWARHRGAGGTGPGRAPNGPAAPGPWGHLLGQVLSSNEGLVFQMERHFIMQVVCEATQCPDTRVSLWGGVM